MTLDATPENAAQIPQSPAAETVSEQIVRPTRKRERSTKEKREVEGIPGYITRVKMPAVTLALHWHLGALLTRYNIPRMHLEYVSGVSVNTIVSLTRDTLNRFNISNAQALLNGMRELTGVDLKLSDLVTVTTSIEGEMVGALIDGPAPTFKPGPLFIAEPEEQAPETAEAPEKPAKPRKPRASKEELEAKRQEAEAKKVTALLAEAQAQGVTVYVIPGTGVNKGSEIGVACSSKSRLREITGLGNNLIYNSGKLVENPQDSATLKAILSKPGSIFIRKPGATFTELKV